MRYMNLHIHCNVHIVYLPCHYVLICRRCDARLEDGNLRAYLVEAPLCPASKVCAEAAVCRRGDTVEFVAPLIECRRVLHPLTTTASIMALSQCNHCRSEVNEYWFVIE